MKIRSLEKRMAAILFVLVLVIFSLANEDTRKLKQTFTGINKDAAQSMQQDLIARSVHTALSAKSRN